jgi:hypothetical protein
MHIAMTAMYDAWAAYDDEAVGTRLGGKLRRPAAERTSANASKAIAHAVHRALLDLYPEDAAWLAEQMRADGHDPDDATTDVSKPQGAIRSGRRRPRRWGRSGCSARSTRSSTPMRT